MNHIQRNKSGLPQNVGHYSKAFHKVKSCRRIQATCGIIPALYSSPGCHHFSDTHALSLSSRNATNEFISDKSLLSMRDVQHVQQRLGHLGVKVFVRETRKSAVWSRCFAIVKHPSAPNCALKTSHTLIMRNPTFAPQSGSECGYRLHSTLDS